MGKTSSLGLGLALALPDRRGVVLDGDGSLLMNLGNLVTIAAGYPSVYRFTDAEGLARGLGEAMGQAGPGFVYLKVAPAWTPAHARPTRARAALARLRTELRHVSGHTSSRRGPGNACRATSAPWRRGSRRRASESGGQEVRSAASPGGRKARV